MYMTIDYGILKINNYFGLLRYDRELTELIEKRFNNQKEGEKQAMIQTILLYLDQSEDKSESYHKIIRMLRSSNHFFSNGFFYALKENKVVA